MKLKQVVMNLISLPKKINYRKTAIVFSAAILIFSSFLWWKEGEGRTIRAKGYLEKMVLGNDGSWFSGKSVDLREVDQQGEKNLSGLSGLTKETLLPIAKDDSEKYFFNNQYYIGDDFELFRRVEDKDVLIPEFSPAEKKLNFVYPSEPLSINNQSVDPGKVVAYSMSDINPGSFIRFTNGKTLNLDDLGSAPTMTLGELKKVSAREYASASGNLLDPSQASFENGAWQEKVGDCSQKSPGQAKLMMDISSDASQGSRSLRLASENHLACVGKQFPLLYQAGKVFKFSFDYKILKGGKADYLFVLLDGKGKKVGEKREAVESSNGDWNHFESVIDPKIKNFRTIKIYLYASSDGRGASENLYDNIEVEAYSAGRDVALVPENLGDDRIRLAQQIKLGGGNNYLSSSGKNNLLDPVAASFEDSPWTNEPMDCSKNVSGNPEMSIKLSNDSVEGSRSLHLSSRNHSACTNKTFPIKGSGQKLYTLSFSYKNLQGGKLGYYYDLEDSSKKILKKRSETIDTEEKKWKNVEIVIDPEGKDFSFIKIFFYSPSLDGKAVDNLYDRVSLKEYLSQDVSDYFLSAGRPVADENKFRSVEYRAQNMFQTRVAVHGAKDNFVLSSSDPFSPSWKAFVFLDDSEPQPLIFPEKYFAPEKDINKQAIRPEIAGFIKDGLISAVGLEFISKNNQGVIRNDNLSRVGMQGSPFSQPVSEKNHFRGDGGENGWLVSVDDLCRGKNLCRKNADGTFDIDILIENVWFKAIYWALFGLLAILLVFLYRFIRHQKKSGSVSQPMPSKAETERQEYRLDNSANSDREEDGSRARHLRSSLRDRVRKFLKPISAFIKRKKAPKEPTIKIFDNKR